jgi:hypothetical protein
MRILLSKISFLALSILIISGCNPLERRGPIASYVQVDSIGLETFNIPDGDNQGSNSHNFSDIWAFVNGQALGMYEFPATVPVINQNGSFRFGFVPGIRVNGITGTRAPYPFMEIFEEEIFVEQGQTVNLVEYLGGVKPKVRYQQNTRFFLRDFEDPNNRLESITPSDTDMVIVDNTWGIDYLENKVAAVHLTPTKPRMYIKTPNDTRLPAGNQIFLEVDYNTTINVTVNVVARLASGEEIRRFVAGMRPTNRDGVRRWNKIYFDLSETVGFLGVAIRHEVYFEAFNNTETDQTLYFDNVKIVHF